MALGRSTSETYPATEAGVRNTQLPKTQQKPSREVKRYGNQFLCSDTEE